MQFLSNYGLFAVKLISLVVAILILFAGLIAIANKGKTKKGKLSIKALNKKFSEYANTILEATQDKKEVKALHKKEKQQKKNRARLYVINFTGDLRASSVNALREEVTALLLVARPKDDVLINIESAGGMVNAYGLAASQLHRIRQANLKLTVCVDKVAASGGYMMAALADHLIAAPFAIIGSIGVIAQVPNFYHFLKDKKIDFEQITAGEFKRTLTLFGENTEKGRLKMQEEVNEMHNLFKDFVSQYRTTIDIDQVATGEHWFGKQALKLNLVDELRTSDDYLLQASKQKDIYVIEYQSKKTLPQKLAMGASHIWQKLFYTTGNY